MARNPALDIAKGIGIILMLVGHIPAPEWLYRGIYLFHMPMFFLISGFLYEKKKVRLREYVIKSFNRLIIPVWLTLIAVCFTTPLNFYVDGDWSALISGIASCLFLSSDPIPTPWGSVQIGPLWFLVALFWTKIILFLIDNLIGNNVGGRDIVILLICFAISLLGLLIRYFLPICPWSILQGATAMQFVGLGWYFKRHTPKKFFICLIIFILPLSYLFGGIEMSNCYYQCLPLDIVGAIGGSAIVVFISKWISSSVKSIAIVLQWVGICSLLILCVHGFDRQTIVFKAFKNLLGLSLSNGWSVFYHYVLTFIVVFLFQKIPFIRKVFQLPYSISIQNL